MFDVDQEAQAIAAEDKGTVVKIIQADGEPALKPDGTPVTWTVCGINSDRYRKTEAWQRKVLRMRAGQDMTDAEHREHHAEFVARCSLGFDGFTSKGEPLTFSTATATAILVKLPHVKRQIEAAMGNHAGFTKPTSSS